MKPSAISLEQAKQILKAAIYVSVSAGIDFLISQTQGTEFGTLTPVINVILVTIRKIFTEA
jgi:hypothetical protein